MKLALVLAAIIIINLFFGYWRSNTKKLSLRWIMAVHIPVPVAIGLRLVFLGWSWPLLPAFVGAYTLGQFTGGRLRRLPAKRKNTQLGSFLPKDLILVLGTEREN